MSVLGAHDNGFPAGGSCCRALLLRPIPANTRQEQKIMNIVCIERRKSGVTETEQQSAEKIFS